LRTDEFDYFLPPRQIAQRPLARRDASRLLLLERPTGRWGDRQFHEFPDLLSGRELIVLNDVRVIPARLFGRRAGIHAQRPGRQSRVRRQFLSSQVEVLLVRQLSDDRWEALVRPGRKIPKNERIIFGDGELEAIVESRGDFGLRILQFHSTTSTPATTEIDALGHIPLPPYIKRADEPSDRERYQTIYAAGGAAVAAPTAGLHFTPEILHRLESRDVDIVRISLNVGLGTFAPVRVEQLENHKIHAESYEISEQAASSISTALRDGRPILAVGTTVVRALEDAAAKVVEAAGRELPRREIAIPPGTAQAQIFLYPGKPFRVVDQLLTNFHLPRSTLLALVAAFAGRDAVLRAYKHAVETGYRFYSYGDCMLIR
jgi:S-adenosylmethionine:tRNA ribosyltransferase-isomerase